MPGLVVQRRRVPGTESALWTRSLARMGPWEPAFTGFLQMQPIAPPRLITPKSPLQETPRTVRRMTAVAAYRRKAEKIPSAEGDLRVAVAGGNFTGTAARNGNAQFAVYLRTAAVHLRQLCSGN